jgi:hypothetical protein
VADIVGRAIAVALPDARSGDGGRRVIDVAVPAGRHAVIRDEATARSGLGDGYPL